LSRNRGIGARVFQITHIGDYANLAASIKKYFLVVIKKRKLSHRWLRKLENF